MKQLVVESSWALDVLHHGEGLSASLERLLPTLQAPGPDNFFYECFVLFLRHLGAGGILALREVRDSPFLQGLK